MLLQPAALTLLTPLVFAASTLPVAMQSLRTGEIGIARNAVVLFGGLSILALGRWVGSWDFQLTALWTWLAIASILVLLHARGMIGGGIAKFMIALLPWFSLWEFLGVIGLGAFVSSLVGRALSREEVQMATPIAVFGFVLLTLRALVAAHVWPNA